MTFTPLDAVALFVSVALLIGAFAWVCARLKLDLAAWGAMAVGSLPPTVYFSVRAGLDLLGIAGWVIVMFSAWAVFLFLVWARGKADQLIYSGVPSRPASSQTSGTTGASVGADLSVPSPAADKQSKSALNGERLGVAYALMGFGGSMAAATGFALLMLFAPSRAGPALVAFRLDHPAFQICAGGLFVGLALFGAGRRLAVRPKQQA